MTLLFPPGKGPAPRRGKGKVLLAPSGQAFSGTYAAGRLGDGKSQDAVILDLDVVGLRAAIPSASEITIRAERPVATLPLAGIDGALRALKTCEDAMLRGWGADPSAMVDPAGIPPMARWFRYEDYPKAALARRATGNVVALIEVDPLGKAMCRPVATSGDEDLDSGTCRILMKRAAYPAAATPARRYAIASVRWFIG